MDPRPIELSAQRGRVRLRLTCLPMGQDLCVLLSGGDREHIGAVALAHPEAEAPSVLARPGHREEDLAKELAARISAQTGATVCLACGIHVDQLRPEELLDILQMASGLTDQLLERLAP